LEAASSNGHSKVVKFLLKKGADVHRANIHKQIQNLSTNLVA